jgi:hypothetical protein
MIKLATADLNTLPYPAISPAESTILRALSELQVLREEISHLRAENQDLRDKISTLEKNQDLQADNSLIQLQLINNIRAEIHKDPQPMQKDRGEILRALIATNDGKMLEKTARQKMHLSKQAFTNLLSTMDDYIISKPYPVDKRKKVLVLK